MKDFEAAVFPEARYYSKNFGHNLNDVVDNLIQISEIVNIIQITCYLIREYGILEKEMILWPLEVRVKIIDKVYLKRQLRASGDENF